MSDQGSNGESFVVATAAQIVGGLILAGIIWAGPLLTNKIGLVWTLTALVASTIVALGLIVGFGVYKRRTKRQQTKLKTTGEPKPSEIQQMATKHGKLISFSVTSVQLLVHVDTDSRAKSTAQVSAEFLTLNARRQSSGLMPHYDAVRFLPITNPALCAGNTVEWRVIRMDFSLLALASDPEASPEGKSEALKVVSTTLSGRAASTNLTSLGVVGVQVCLVTSDRRVLLRRRGKNVLFARDRWDVSASGFCGNGHVVQGYLDPSLTIAYEVENEIGHLQGDPRQIRILGVFTNARTGAVDVLACWTLDSSTDDVVQALANSNTEERQVFDTEKRAVERYVWDSKNLLVPLDSDIMRKTFLECDIYGSDFEPQSLFCLQRSVEHVTGKTLDLALAQERPN